MDHGILGAGGAIAKVPNKCVVVQVDIRMECNGHVGAIGETLVGLHGFVVEGKA